MTRSMHTQRAARAGLTLIEVMVASAILSLLALVLMSATVPLSRVSSEAAIAQDMDRTAARVLAQLRRELRQTGWLNTAARFGETALDQEGEILNGSNQLMFQMRTGPADADWTSTVTIARAAGSPGSYRGVPSTLSPNARYRVTRAQNGLETVLAEDVYDLSFLMNSGEEFIQVTLVLLRPDPNWTGGTPPPPIIRRYVERIELMNHKQ